MSAADCPAAQFHGKPHRYCACGWTEPDPPVHPSVAALLRYFEYAHLPASLQDVSRPIGQLAREMAHTLPQGPELTTGLRKLLEAKDCLVRAALDAPREADD